MHFVKLPLLKLDYKQKKLLIIDFFLFSLFFSMATNTIYIAGLKPVLSHTEKSCIFLENFQRIIRSLKMNSFYLDPGPYPDGSTNVELCL